LAGTEADVRSETIVGIDLSGPSNTGETAVAIFRSDGEVLRFERCTEGTDTAIRDAVYEASRKGPVAVGLDAPLSYQPGGGDRPRDRALRKRLIEVGLHPGSVMAPTMSRMCYLTLRGLAIARLLQFTGVAVVEVQPGACTGRLYRR
jgi:predicted nuclease with RNAse H fold